MSKFSLLGDSNVKRHMTLLSCRDRPHMSSAELRVCGHYDIFNESLRSIRSESDAVILSCLSNFITNSPYEGFEVSAAARVEPLLLEVREVLLSFCQEFADRSWFLAPPMYRTTPLWYRDGMSEILLKFSEVFTKEKPVNLFLMPSFHSPVLEADGVHLTPFSGLHFVVSLFDSALELLKNSKRPASAMVPIQQESIRSLEDCVSVIEQDHKRLNQSVINKSVVTSEAADYAENQRCVRVYQ